MTQTVMINISEGDLTTLISKAVENAVNKRLTPSQEDRLLTQQEAANYLRSSKVFVWQLAKDGKIKVVNANRKTLYPKSAIDHYLQLNK